MCVCSGYEVVSYPITDQLSEEEVVAEDDKGDKSGKDDDGGKSVPPCVRCGWKPLGSCSFRIRIRIFIVPVQVYKEICLTVRSNK